MVQVEAWRELTTPAQKVFQEGHLVSITNASIAARRSDKSKFSLSGCRWMIRFDKNTEVQPGANDAAEVIPDWPDHTAQDIPCRTPRSSLEMTACLSDCAVTVVARVVEMRQKDNQEQPVKSFVKAVLQDCNGEGEVYQADLLAYSPEHRQEMQKALRENCVYEISPVLTPVVADNRSFSLKWTRQTKVKDLTGTAEATGVAAEGGVGVAHVLSEPKHGAKDRVDYTSRPAKLVAASVLAAFVPDRGVLKSLPDEVWEMPCAMILDIAASSGDVWSYEGCSVCCKRNGACTHGADKRICYNALLSLSDHTATIEVRAWTEAMDEIYRALGCNEPVVDVAQAADFVAAARSKYWIARCVVTEESAYQSRAARNRLQLVSVREQVVTFPGTSKALFSLHNMSCRPGVPAIFLGDVKVDAAEQVLDASGRIVEFAEFLVQLRGDPSQDGKDSEKGVRISFGCEDIGDTTNTGSELQWVLGMKDMLRVARLQADSLLRVVAQPQIHGRKIARWQVLFYTCIRQEDIDPWRQRKQWQAISPGEEKKKRAAEQIGLATPNTKLTKVVKELQSPSYSAGPVK